MDKKKVSDIIFYILIITENIKRVDPFCTSSSTKHTSYDISMYHYFKQWITVPKWLILYSNKFELYYSSKSDLEIGKYVSDEINQ